MEVHKAIIINSWNAKFSGVVTSCKDKHVYMIFHVINCLVPSKIKASFSKLALYHTTLKSKELSSRVNILIICYFFDASFCEIKIKNDKGNRIFCSIQDTICKFLKHKATIFLSSFYQHLIKNQR